MYRLCRTRVWGRDWRRKIKEKKEQAEIDQFWNYLSLEFFGGYGNSNFTFTSQNNTSIDRPYINEVTY